VPIELAHRTLQTKNAVVDLAWNNDGNAFVTSKPGLFTMHLI
jgi:hypothetical protein